MANNLSGSGVALITPFKNDLSVDFNALERLINHCINGGINYLVTMGTTGESVTLSKEEKYEIIQATIQFANGRVPIVAGFGGNDTSSLIKEIQSFDFNGIDAVLSVSPYYNKPTQDGLFEHYKNIALNSPKPIILYNVPGRTGMNMKAETTLKLANEFKNIIGIKEASGDFSQCNQLAINKPKDFLLISGDDNITLPLISLGFDGVISVSGQGFPNYFSKMVNAALNGDFIQARCFHYPLVNVTDLLFAEGNPAGIKEALKYFGICSNTLRLPLVPVSENLSGKIIAQINKFNLS